MMKKPTHTIRGRIIVPGRVRGEAVVSGTPLCFLSEFNPLTGRVIDPAHPLWQRLLAGKILVMPSTKGSSGNPMHLRVACLEGKAPLALVNTEIDPLAALACVVNQIPMMVISERDLELIPDGAWLEVDGDQQLLKVFGASEGR